LELTFKYFTASQARKRLGLSRYQFDVRLNRGILPQPTFVDVTRVRYFDEQWLRTAIAILDNAVQVT